MSFVSNGGKFKLYTVLNGLLFPTPTQPRISFERAILSIVLPGYQKLSWSKVVMDFQIIVEAFASIIF
jgi:hypothetical protein